MDAASTAYVVDDRLVLIDASSAQGAVWNGISELSEVAASGMSAMPLRPYQVRLSPDGTTALVAMRFDSSQRLLGIRLAVLDVATAEVSVEDLPADGRLRGVRLARVQPDGLGPGLKEGVLRLSWR